MSADIRRAAVFSRCGAYRYSLTRRWTAGPVVHFVMLNPSIASAEVDDPTARRVVNFAQIWGFGGLIVTNLFAVITSDPRVMMQAPDPIGPCNDEHILSAHLAAAATVAAWGTGGAHLGRGEEVRAMLPDLHYLRLTKDGHPSHPLYLPGDLAPVRWVSP